MSIFKLSEDKKEQDIKNNEPEVSENLNNSGEVKDKNEDTEITINGPLSSIYAKALNIAYAKESIFTMLPTNAEMSAPKKRIYIYCCNGDTLDNNELIEAENSLRLAMDSKKYNKVVAVLESTKMNKKLVLLDDIVNKMSIETIYKKDTAINRIISLNFD